MIILILVVSCSGNIILLFSQYNCELPDYGRLLTTNSFYKCQIKQTFNCFITKEIPLILRSGLYMLDILLKCQKEKNSRLFVAYEEFEGDVSLIEIMILLYRALVSSGQLLAAVNILPLL